MKNYSLAIAGLDANVVVSSANAAKALVELSNGLPNTGGIVSWFTGDNDIASFGAQLVSFGQSFASYYASVSTVDVAKLNGVVAEFRNLVDLANDIKNVDTSGMSSFAQNLTNLGNAGIDEFINAFTNANSRVSTAATTMITTFIAGIRSKDQAVKDTFVQIVSDCLTAIRNKYTDFYNAGKYLVEGFANGITEHIWYAEAKARAMARAAADAAAKELDEHSPSKVGYRIGDFFGVAFVNAIGDYEDKSYKAGSRMAEAARTGLSNAISKVKDFITNSIDTQPTIRPVLDLSNVKAETSRLNALFSRTQALSISAGMNRQDDSEVQNEETISNNGSTFKFIQNNYSPKALSRVEIYRQTKNQFSAMERAVRA